MHRVIFHVILFIAFIFAPCLADAQQPSVKVRFVTEHWPPYNYVNDAGHLDGIAYNKINNAVKQLNWSADFKLYHWAKSVNLAKNQPGTFVFSIYLTEERLNEFQWICPLISTEPVSFFRLASRSDISLTAVDDAKQYVTGVIREGLALEALSKAGFKVNSQLYVAMDDKTNLNQLINGRIDLLVDERSSLDFRLKNSGLTHVELTQLLPVDTMQEKELCVATSKRTDPKLVDQLRNALTNK